MRHPLPSDRIVPRVAYNPYRPASNLGRAFAKLLEFSALSRNPGNGGVSATQYIDSLFPDIVSNRQAAVIMNWRFHHENYCWTEDRYGYVIKGIRPEGTLTGNRAQAAQPSLDSNQGFHREEPQQVTRARRRRRRFPPGYTIGAMSDEVRIRTISIDEYNNGIEAEPETNNEPLDRVGETFGIELEFFFPSQFSLTTLAGRLSDIVGVDCRYESYNHQVRNYWKVTTDASVMEPPTGWTAGELVSPPLKPIEENYAIIDRICEVLETMECTINKTCGLHVHIKVVNNLPLFKRMAKNYRNAQRAIDTIMPPSRREGGTTYAKTCKHWEDSQIDRSRTVKSLVEHLTNGTIVSHRNNSGTGSRFYNLNFHSFWRHGTVEFRQHSGTINNKKIRHWIAFCLQFVEAAKCDAPLLKNDYLNNVMTSMNLPEETKEFYQYRARVLAAA